MRLTGLDQYGNPMDRRGEDEELETSRFFQTYTDPTLDDEDPSRQRDAPHETEEDLREFRDRLRSNAFQERINRHHSLQHAPVTTSSSSSSSSSSSLPRDGTTVDGGTRPMRGATTSEEEPEDDDGDSWSDDDDDGARHGRRDGRTAPPGHGGGDDDDDDEGSDNDFTELINNRSCERRMSRDELMGRWRDGGKYEAVLVDAMDAGRGRVDPFMFVPRDRLFLLQNDRQLSMVLGTLLPLTFFPRRRLITMTMVENTALFLGLKEVDRYVHQSTEAHKRDRSCPVLCMLVLSNESFQESIVLTKDVFFLVVVLDRDPNPSSSSSASSRPTTTSTPTVVSSSSRTQPTNKNKKDSAWCFRSLFFEIVPNRV
jgi:hypothetical protein